MCNSDERYPERAMGDFVNKSFILDASENN
jgi:hypothetical protein